MIVLNYNPILPLPPCGSQVACAAPFGVENEATVMSVLLDMSVLFSVTVITGRLRQELPRAAKAAGSKTEDGPPWRQSRVGARLRPLLQSSSRPMTSDWMRGWSLCFFDPN